MLSIVLALVMVLAIAVSASAEWKFERKVEIVCGYGVGGGMDGTLRPMANLLTDILGVPVEIVNVEGGSGVNGIEYAYKQPADGYTFMGGSQSLFMQDLAGTTSMDYKNEFIPVDMLVQSINIVGASKVSMDKYGVKTWSDLAKYMEEHPYEVSLGMLSATGVDGMSVAQTFGDLAILEVPYTSGSDLNAALVGGHCDLAITGTDEVAGLVESGDIVPLLALCENRMSIYPDMQCSGELGIESYMGPWRAIFAKKGTPQEAIDAMVAAIEEARVRPEWQEFLKMAAYDERTVPTAAELPAFAEAEWKGLRDYMLEQGTLTKDYPELQ